MSDINIKGTIGRDHYRVVLTAGKNTIIADEPISNGGGDEGMNPHRYWPLLSAHVPALLSGCTRTARNGPSKA